MATTTAPQYKATLAMMVWDASKVSGNIYTQWYSNLTAFGQSQGWMNAISKTRPNHWPADDHSPLTDTDEQEMRKANKAAMVHLGLVLQGSIMASVLEEAKREPGYATDGAAWRVIAALHSRYMTQDASSLSGMRTEIAEVTFHKNDDPHWFFDKIETIRQNYGGGNLTTLRSDDLVQYVFPSLPQDYKLMITMTHSKTPYTTLTDVRNDVHAMYMSNRSVKVRSYNQAHGPGCNGPAKTKPPAVEYAMTTGAMMQPAQPQQQGMDYAMMASGMMQPAQQHGQVQGMNQAMVPAVNQPTNPVMAQPQQMSQLVNHHLTQNMVQPQQMVPQMTQPMNQAAVQQMIPPAVNHQHVQHGTSLAVAPVVPNGGNGNRGTPVCWNCGQPGHTFQNCPQPRNPNLPHRPPQRMGAPCEHCGRRGHLSQDCWSLDANTASRPSWWNDAQHNVFRNGNGGQAQQAQVAQPIQPSPQAVLTPTFIQGQQPVPHQGYHHPAQVSASAVSPTQHVVAPEPDEDDGMEFLMQSVDIPKTPVVDGPVPDSFFDSFETDTGNDSDAEVTSVTQVIEMLAEVTKPLWAEDPVVPNQNPPVEITPRSGNGVDDSFFDSFGPDNSNDSAPEMDTSSDTESTVILNTVEDVTTANPTASPGGESENPATSIDETPPCMITYSVGEQDQAPVSEPTNNTHTPIIRATSPAPSVSMWDDSSLEDYDADPLDELSCSDSSEILHLDDIEVLATEEELLRGDTPRNDSAPAPAPDPAPDSSRPRPILLGHQPADVDAEDFVEDRKPPALERVPPGPNGDSPQHDPTTKDHGQDNLDDTKLPASAPKDTTTIDDPTLNPVLKSPKPPDPGAMNKYGAFEDIPVIVRAPILHPDYDYKQFVHATVCRHESKGIIEIALFEPLFQLKSKPKAYIIASAKNEQAPILVWSEASKLAEVTSDTMVPLFDWQARFLQKHHPVHMYKRFLSQNNIHLMTVILWNREYPRPNHKVDDWLWQLEVNTPPFNPWYARVAPPLPNPSDSDAQVTFLISVANSTRMPMIYWGNPALDFEWCDTTMFSLLFWLHHHDRDKTLDAFESFLKANRLPHSDHNLKHLRQGLTPDTTVEQFLHQLDIYSVRQYQVLTADDHSDDTVLPLEAGEGDSGNETEMLEFLQANVDLDIDPENENVVPNGQDQQQEVLRRGHQVPNDRDPGANNEPNQVSFDESHEDEPHFAEISADVHELDVPSDPYNEHHSSSDSSVHSSENISSIVDSYSLRPVGTVTRPVMPNDFLYSEKEWNLIHDLETGQVPTETFDVPHAVIDVVMPAGFYSNDPDFRRKKKALLDASVKTSICLAGVVPMRCPMRPHRSRSWNMNGNMMPNFYLTRGGPYLTHSKVKLPIILPFCDRTVVFHHIFEVDETIGEERPVNNEYDFILGQDFINEAIDKFHWSTDRVNSMTTSEIVYMPAKETNMVEVSESGEKNPVSLEKPCQDCTGLPEIVLNQIGISTNYKILFDPNVWVFDTGATSSATPFDIGFTSKQNPKSSDATMGFYGSPEVPKHIGNIKGTWHDKYGNRQHSSSVLMSDVKYQPKGRFNLFSTSTLTKKGWIIGGDSKSHWILHPKTGFKVSFDIPVQTSAGVLYCGYFKRQQSPHETGLIDAAVTPAKKKISIQQLHDKLGHVNEADNRKTAAHLGWEITRGTLKNCPACSVGKAKQRNIPKNPQPEPLGEGERRVHLDIATLRRKRGLKTGRIARPQWRLCVWPPHNFKQSEFYATKDAMVEPFCRQLSWYEKKGQPVTHVRMDNAGENQLLIDRAESADWKFAIVWEQTARNTPQQNSVVEVGFPTLLKQSMATMYRANVPPEYIHRLMMDVITTTTNLSNLVVVTVNGVTKTRFEHQSGFLPSFAHHLRTWGEAGTVTLTSKLHPKLKKRGRVCMFIGYAPHHAGDCYRMWDPETNRVHQTRDIIWLHRMYFEQPLNQMQETIDLIVPAWEDVTADPLTPAEAGEGPAAIGLEETSSVQSSADTPVNNNSSQSDSDKSSEGEQQQQQVEDNSSESSHENDSDNGDADEIELNNPLSVDQLLNEDDDNELIEEQDFPDPELDDIEIEFNNDDEESIGSDLAVDPIVDPGAEPPSLDLVVL